MHFNNFNLLLRINAVGISIINLIFTWGLEIIHDMYSLVKKGNKGICLGITDHENGKKSCIVSCGCKQAFCFNLLYFLDNKSCHLFSGGSK